MRKLGILLGVALIVSLAAGSVAQAQPVSAKDTLLLVCSKIEKLTIYKVEDRKLTELKKLPIGKYALEVWVSPNGKRGYVSNGDSNTITVVDLAKLEIVATIAHPDLLGPDGAAMTPDSKTMYVASMKRDSVFEIDAQTNKVVREIKVQIKVPRRILLSPDLKKMYVAGNKTSAIAVVDIATGKQERAIKTGREPRGGLTWLPDGKTIVNASVEDDTLSLITAETGEVTLTIGVPPSPQRVFVAPGGSPIYVGTRMGPSKVMQIKDPFVHDSHKFAETGKYLWGMAITKDFKTAFVANAQEATLSIVDLSEMKTVGTFAVDKDSTGLALRQ
jgi:YVTN family beta-propeller protein